MNSSSEFFGVLVGLYIIVLSCCFWWHGQNEVILSCAHVAHVIDVLGLCDVMSIWSWAHVFHVLVFCIVYCLVMGICWAYVMHDAHNSSLIIIARLLLELLETFLSIFSGLPADMTIDLPMLMSC